MARYIPLVLPHYRLKNEVCYTFIPLVSSHGRVKNEIYYTPSLFVSLYTSPVKIRAT